MRVVVVAGAKDYMNSQHVSTQLDRLEPDMVVHGGGRSGVDKMANNWATARAVACLRFVAKWQADGRAAGPRRNGRMLDFARSLLEQHDVLVVAFSGGRGTEDFVRQARAAGLEVREV